MSSPFMIGLTAEDMIALDALDTPLPDPQWEFQQFRKMSRLGDMGLKGRGPRTVIWQFPLLEVAQITQLEEFKSEDPIFIQTLKRDDVVAIFEVQPNWPDPRQDGEHSAGLRGHRRGLMLEFVVLTEVEGS